MTPTQKPPTPEEMQAARDALRESTDEIIAIQAPTAAPVSDLDAITKVLRIHSGEDFTAYEFPTFEDGKAAWEAWQRILRFGYLPGKAVEVNG